MLYDLVSFLSAGKKDGTQSCKGLPKRRRCVQATERTGFCYDLMEDGRGGCQDVRAEGEGMTGIPDFTKIALQDAAPNAAAAPGEGVAPGLCTVRINDLFTFALCGRKSPACMVPVRHPS